MGYLIRRQQHVDTAHFPIQLQLRIREKEKREKSAWDSSCVFAFLGVHERASCTFGPGSMSFCLILTVVSMKPEQLPIRSGWDRGATCGLAFSPSSSSLSSSPSPSSPSLAMAESVCSSSGVPCQMKTNEDRDESQEHFLLHTMPLVNYNSVLKKKQIHTTLSSLGITYHYYGSCTLLHYFLTTLHIRKDKSSCL